MFQYLLGKCTVDGIPLPPLDAPDASTLHTPIKNETDPASTQASAATVASGTHSRTPLSLAPLRAPLFWSVLAVQDHHLWSRIWQQDTLISLALSLLLSPSLAYSTVEGAGTAVVFLA